MQQARLILAATLAPIFTFGIQAAPAIFPLKDVRAGQHGIGRTVFSGTRVEDFQVEILGVLKNIGPRESIILAKLSGGPLAETGVLQGMSGSPVYIDGKLVGAVALGFPQAKEAIAGIRPIEEMLRVDPDSATRLAKSIPPRRSVQAGNARLEEIATPVSFSGFTAATLDRFGSQLRALGLDPRQGVSGGGDPPAKLGDPKQLQPGSMISVQLLTGDMSVGADGTVTYIDGDRVYAFGHRFLDEGATNLPFARSEVLALLPNISSSFKISTARDWMGTITEDRNTAVSGLLGRRAEMAPIEIRVGRNRYRMNVIEDRVMTPLVAQMAVFSAIDETERSIGASTFSIRGHLDFNSGSVRIDDVYGGDVGVSALASLGVGTPLAYALSSGFDALKLKAISLDIDEIDRRNQLQISSIAAPRQVRPGEDVDLIVTMSGQNGGEVSKTAHYRVPAGALPGVLYFTAEDSTSANLAEFQAAAGSPPRSAGQVIERLNSQRVNTSAYLRVWRAEAAYNIDGRDLPDVPPSLALILGRAQASGANPASWRGSTLAEIAVSAAGDIVTGSKTIQVEVTE
ncbi:MAG: SpoIVB peptidase S55 domain-containing protein [Bryobacteraceae bacterium]